MSAAPLTISVGPLPAGIGPEGADAIIGLLEQRMAALHIELQRRIVETKLSGQVLQVRTGALRRSIEQETRRSGDVITSSVFSGLVYAAIHEFGGVITPKSAQALVFEIDGRKIFAHMVRMPARPYMGPTFEDMREEIVSGLQTALDEGIAAA